MVAYCGYYCLSYTIVHVMTMPDLMIVANLNVSLGQNNHKARKRRRCYKFLKEIHGTFFVLYVLWHQVSTMKTALLTKSGLVTLVHEILIRKQLNILFPHLHFYLVSPNCTFNPFYRLFENIKI